MPSHDRGHKGGGVRLKGNMATVRVLLLVVLGGWTLGIECVPLAKARCRRAVLRDAHQTLPEADGRLHVHALPIGQGETNVIQCPDGSLSIFDFGSSNAADDGFWTATEIQDFLSGHFDRIVHVIVSHNHYDHLKFLGEVQGMLDLPRLEKIHISCTEQSMHSILSAWVDVVGGRDKLQTYNEGRMCGPRGGPCGRINICPGHSHVMADVLAANLGACSGDNINMDSLAIKLSFGGDISVLLSGDLEDLSDDPDEEGPLKWMRDHYGSSLRVTAYQVTHHGASSTANKEAWLETLRPRAVWATGDPWFRFRSPRCAVFDRLVDEVDNSLLCKPLETDPESSEYCGSRIDPDLDPEELLQDSYTCGHSSYVEERRGNEYAIYTTVEDQYSINRLDFSTDGNKWGMRRYNTPTIG